VYLNNFLQKTRFLYLQSLQQLRKRLRLLILKKNLLHLPLKKRNPFSLRKILHSEISFSLHSYLSVKKIIHNLQGGDLLNDFLVQNFDERLFKRNCQPFFFILFFFSTTPVLV